jgi:hypothetical protein
MRLSGIEIVVGEPSENVTASRELSYRLSFRNDAGEECLRRHESFVLERTLYDAAAIARIVGDILRGLLAEDVDAVGTRLSPAVSRTGVPDRSSPTPI